MSKRTARVPRFNKVFSHVKDLSKHWYKKYTARRNRKKLHQARDMEDHVDRRLNPWDLD
jgi:hypothetical protein